MCVATPTPAICIKHAHRLTPVLQAIELKSPEPGPYELRVFAGMMVIEQEVVVHAVFAERLELHAFPFDCQDLSIEVQWRMSEDEGKIWPMPANDFVEVEVNKMAISEWKLHPPVVEFSHVAKRTIDENLKLKSEEQPVLLIRLKVERIWISYIYQVFMVMSLICAATAGAFALPVEETGDRLAHVTTMFLTAVAFQFVVSTLLPKLNYLTVADKYILVCNFYITFVLLTVAGLAYAQSHHDLDTSLFLDSGLLIATACAWLFIHLGLFLYVRFETIPKEKKKLTMSSHEIDEIQEVLESLKVPSDAMVAHNVAELLDNPPDKDGSKKKELSVYSGLPTSKLNAPNGSKAALGIFQADYSHGIESFSAFTFSEAGKNRFCLRKITGDPNVPAGRASIVASMLPIAGGEPVSAKIQVRMDIYDKDGFSFLEGQLSCPEPGTYNFNSPSFGIAMVFEKVI